MAPEVPFTFFFLMNSVKVPQMNWTDPVNRTIVECSSSVSVDRQSRRLTRETTTRTITMTKMKTQTWTYAIKTRTSGCILFKYVWYLSISCFRKVCEVLCEWCYGKKHSISLRRGVVCILRSFLCSVSLNVLYSHLLINTHRNCLQHLVSLSNGLLSYVSASRSRESSSAEGLIETRLDLIAKTNAGMVRYFTTLKINEMDDNTKSDTLRVVWRFVSIDFYHFT